MGELEPLQSKKVLELFEELESLLPLIMEGTVEIAANPWVQNPEKTSDIQRRVQKVGSVLRQLNGLVTNGGK